MFSADEYCASVWLNSSHVHKVDAQLNNTMRMIAGVIQSTPKEWLPVLSHIPPPNLRRINALIGEYNKIQQNQNLPIRSWQQEWSAKQNISIPCITHEPPGFHLPRKSRSALNRVRIEHGRCANAMHKWGKAPTPFCEFGAIQAVRHIVKECPRTAYSAKPENFLTATPESIAYLQFTECLSLKSFD
ncbi:hypothetical protein AAG570_005391 [Ranatra chinensis]|uniref:Uncharacterized protein n=1 Tax=Ranatra chinensis TaxID=642074 RepID=A0ABD0Y165_9HEMI